MAKLAIKSDVRKQKLLLPPSLYELVPENHMVRVVDAVIERLDIKTIINNINQPLRYIMRRDQIHNIFSYFNTLSFSLVH